ncbi:MAG TPA: M12 family metallopeptidase [Kofleriaceae bacterium]|nr:M12 family metallopeptidase [Kofleriaceae bacterium]
MNRHLIHFRSVTFSTALLSLLAGCVETSQPVGDEPIADELGDSGSDGERIVGEEGAWGVARVRTASGESQLVDYQVVDGNAIHDGDIDLGPVSRLRQRGGAARLGERWPSNTVYYAFDPGFGAGECAADASGNSLAWTPLQIGSAANCVCWTGGTHCVHVRTRAREVIADLDARLPLKFVEVSTDDSRHKLLIRWGGTDPDSNPAGRAEVGHMDDLLDNYQHMTFRKAHEAEDPEVAGNGAYNLQPVPGTMRHEMLHTIGVWHEQSRADRDQFVDLHDECMDGEGGNYDLHDESADVGPYDFRSIMHYYANAFCAKDDDDDDNDGKTDECKPDCWTMTKDSTGLHNGIGPRDGAIPWDPSEDSGAFSDLTADDKNTLFHMYASAPDTNAADEHFGNALAVADFDDDGYDDVAVGVPEQDVAGVTDAGYVVIYKGTATGLVFYQEVSASTLAGYGAIAGAKLGTALAAGDINDDGVDDLAIGAPGQPADGQSAAGMVVLMLGSRGGLWPSHYVDQADLSGAVNNANENFGAALAMGDLAGIGRDQLVVGAPRDRNLTAAGNESPTGAVYVFAFSKDANPAMHKPTRVKPSITELGSGFGSALAVGEFDDTTTATRDLAVGAPTHGTGGKVHLFTGRKPPEVAAAWSNVITLKSTITSPWADAQFGASLSMGNLSIGNYYRTELAIGAPAFSNGAGVVRVVELQSDGGATFLLNSISASQQSGARYGASVLIADVDRQSVSDDLIVGEPGATDHGGRVWVGRGGVNGLPLGNVIYQRRAAPLADEDATDLFGAAIAVGQVDGYGNVPSSDDKSNRYRDLVVGAPGAAPDLASIANPTAPEDPAGAGAVYMFVGTSTVLAGREYTHQERSGRL